MTWGAMTKYVIMRDQKASKRLVEMADILKRYSSIFLVEIPFDEDELQMFNEEFYEMICDLEYMRRDLPNKMVSRSGAVKIANSRGQWVEDEKLKDLSRSQKAWKNEEYPDYYITMRKEGEYRIFSKNRNRDYYDGDLYFENFNAAKKKVRLISTSGNDFLFDL